MDKTAPCEHARHCTSFAPPAPCFAPPPDQLARLLAPALLDRVRGAVIVLGIDHRIWVWSAAEVLGRPIHTLLPADGTVFAGSCCRPAAATAPIETDFGAIPCTLSIGVAVAGPGMESPSQKLIQFADDALYRAKRGGRNRVEMASG